MINENIGVFIIIILFTMCMMSQNQAHSTRSLERFGTGPMIFEPTGDREIVYKYSLEPVYVKA